MLLFRPTLLYRPIFLSPVAASPHPQFPLHALVKSGGGGAIFSCPVSHVPAEPQGSARRTDPQRSLTLSWLSDKLTRAANRPSAYCGGTAPRRKYPSSVPQAHATWLYGLWA
eukprot:scaffold85601_cov31-Tisochrysis_lutea.AAC.3